MTIEFKSENKDELTFTNVVSGGLNVMMYDDSVDITLFHRTLSYEEKQKLIDYLQSE